MGIPRRIRTSVPTDFSLEMYLSEIARYPLLTREQEIEIANRIRKGDKKARKQMITSNLRLVVKIANDLYSGIVPLKDLIQEGNIGLMIACDGRYDPKKSKFSTYSPWYIKREMKKARHTQGRDIKTPREGKVSIEYLFLDAETKTAHSDNGKNGTAGETGHERMKDDSPLPSEIAEKSNNYALLRDSLSLLDEQERQVIEMRFGLNGYEEYTLEEIGKKFKKTGEWVRKIVENKAMNKLRGYFHRMNNPLDTLINKPE